MYSCFARTPIFCYAKGLSGLSLILLLGLGCAKQPTGKAAQIAAKPTPKQPNIVFILTDDHRWDELGVTGHPVVKTPHLDQLAKEGIYFENAYVSSAICTPSRASIFLGQYERRHSINFNSGTAMAPEAWANSYPALLKKAGYYLGYVGKNHVPIGPKGYQDSLMEKTFDFWYAGHGHLGFYPKKRHAIFQNSRFDTQVEVMGEGVRNFFFQDSTFTGGASAFFRQCPSNQPFCLSIAFNVPHGAGTSSMRQLSTDPVLYRDRYRDTEIPFSPLYIPKDSITHPKLPAGLLHVQYRQKGYSYVDTRADLTERKIRRYQTITGVDQLIGAVRELLDQRGVTNQTIIVFTADHGIMEGEWGLGGKALNYEACLKVPFIVYDPTLASHANGRTETRFIQTIDIAPTMLQWAGMDIPQTMQGMPLQPLLAGDTSGWRTALFGENLWSNWFGNPRIESVRIGKWKYIRYFRNDNGAPPQGKAAYVMTPARAKAYESALRASIEGEQPIYEELFDLEQDPLENHNLATDPRYGDQLTRLSTTCQQMVTTAASTGKPAVLPYIK